MALREYFRCPPPCWSMMTTLSAPPDANRLPSLLYDTAYTASLCPFSEWITVGGVVHEHAIVHARDELRTVGFIRNVVAHARTPSRPGCPTTSQPCACWVSIVPSQRRGRRMAGETPWWIRSTCSPWRALI